jgi:hypothetical protein
LKIMGEVEHSISRPRASFANAGADRVVSVEVEHGESFHARPSRVRQVSQSAFFVPAKDRTLGYLARA